ncbi:MAG: T9SS type A sorting domain-containing protein [Flavobacteriales bacterium]|nr:T9SS type A sorting domain-containing protein [Flavobacteriales bacterium]
MRKIKYVIFVFLSFATLASYAQNNPPIAVDDFDSTGSGGGGINMVLSNDSDPDGDNFTIDTILLNSNNSSSSVLGGFIISYQSNKLFYGIDTVYYVICDDGIPSMCDTGRLIVEVTYVLWEAYAHLDVNMIKARFNADGSDFWDASLGNPSFEVPKGGGKHTIFASSLWIGGKDALDSLHLAATRYNGAGQDVYTGPIMDTAAYSFSQDSLWNQLWKVNKSEIDNHIANWQSPGYTVPDAILTWPAHGDVALGQAAFLAPFFDLDGDQIYEPLGGDYPVIRGDQAIYFIRNDQRGPHDETGAAELGIEIHGMAYAYDNPSNYALNHTVFVKYKIVNRSANTYTDTYLGVNFDPDIGDAFDDYIECDVKRNAVIGYNGLAVDGTGAPEHYGDNPPAQALVYLKGPLMDADGVDNASGSCDASLNGFGFGDSIIDNEALGMTHFAYYCNPGGGCNGAVQGDPETGIDYYNYMKSMWKDGTQQMYGGNGHINNCTSCEPSNFMFPNISDTCNWGTMGNIPGDIVPWNDLNAGNSASDRRGISSAGPFTFSAGDTIEFDIAYVYARDMDTLNPNPAYASVLMLAESTDSIQEYYNQTILPGDTIKLVGSTMDISPVGTIKLHPNPAKDYLTVDITGTGSVQEYEIFDITGRLLQSGKIDVSRTIGIGTLPNGAFIINLRDQDRIFRAKFVKI